MNTDLDGLLEFLLYVGQAKRTFRTGWLLHCVEKIDNVADHMYRMAVMSLLLPTISEECKVRCMKLALVHDLSESVVDDLTELDGIPTNEKRRRETEAMLYLTSLLPADVGREIFSLFNEYKDQKTQEAKLVKDLDRFDMLLQAYEYEKLQSDSEFFDDFFSGSAHNIKSEIVRRWLKQLLHCRSSGKDFQLPSDSNLNQMLKHILYDDQGTFLYNCPSKSNKTSQLPPLDATQLLTNLLKHQPN